MRAATVTRLGLIAGNEQLTDRVIVRTAITGERQFAVCVFSARLREAAVPQKSNGE